MYPNCSNTRGSLLRLAIEFGSQGFYDTVDNSCLITILDMLDVTNLDSKNILSNSLFLAIKHQNDEAVEILINKGANFTELLGNEISNDELLEMPIMKIFNFYNVKDQHQEIFDKYFQENSDKIIKKLIKLKVDNIGFLQLLSNINLNSQSGRTSVCFCTLILKSSTFSSGSTSNVKINPTRFLTCTFMPPLKRRTK